MRVTRAVFVVPLLGLVQCGPVTVPVSSTPLNTCTGCTGTDIQCVPTESGDACLSTRSIPSYVLVVNVPESAIYAPGEVLTLTPDQVKCAARAGCSLTCKTNATVPSDSTCVQLPGLYEATGAYVVTSNPSTSTLLGNPPGVSTTVPAQTSYTPMWPLSPPCAQPCAIEASLLNLPLPTVLASSSVPGVPPGTFGPESKLPTGWTALLPALSSGYIQSVNFTSPLGAAFPSVIQPSEQLGQGNTFGQIDVVSPLLQATTIEISPPGSVEGWTVFFRDPTTGRVVSSQPVVKGGSASVQWLAAGVLSSFSSAKLLGDSGYYIVLSPPASAVGLPEFADLYTGPTGTSPTGVILSNEAYPSVPKPVTISGTVRSPVGAVSASLHFASVKLYSFLANAPTTCSIEFSDAALLHYDVVVSTADRLAPGGAVGKYSVVLPQGTYIITVDPDATSGSAKEIFGNTLSTPPGIAVALPSTASRDSCQNTTETHDFALEPQLNVTGTVLIADGRALANATVDLTPAAILLTSPLTPVAQVDGPRPFEVATGADGSFSAAVDPGTYDVTVRPVDGTRFPWIVSPAHTFSKSHTNLDPLFVPAPVPLSLTLHDPLADLPIAQAVVSAYAITTCSPAPCNGVALQISQGFTDSNGSFQMFLTPVPFTPETR